MLLVLEEEYDLCIVSALLLRLQVMHRANLCLDFLSSMLRHESYTVARVKVVALNRPTSILES
jgi:hypothetical protein